MTRWKKDSTVFVVRMFKSVNRDGSESKMCTIPRPLADRFGACESLRFTITDGRVCVEGVMSDG